MEQIFKSVLLLSLVGAVLSSALFLLKPFTKKVFGNHWQYYIWLCVLVVMMLPVSFKTPVKQDLNITALQSQQTVQENNIVGADSSTGQTPVVVNEQAPMEYPGINIVKSIPLNLLEAIIYVWLLGTVIFFYGGLISYWLFLRRINKSSMVIFCPELELIKEQMNIKGKIRVITTELLNAPLMVGIFKPTLLLPNTPMGQQDLHYILLHELTHLKKHDLWYKWFAVLVNSVHWFNPLIYFVTRQVNEECEISCDLSVTRDMSEDEKKGYMNTIVSLLSANKEKSKMLTTAMAGDKRQIIRRFTMINKVTKKNKAITLTSVAAAVIIFTVTVFASGVLRNETQGKEAFNSGIKAFDVDAPVKNKTNVLLIGVDESQMHSDVLILVSLDHVNKNLTLMSIPRDTLITANDQYNKISALTAGDDKDQDLINAVRENLAIPVHYYIRINFEGFRNIVDILGGVEFDVPIKMYYDDPAQNLHIALEGGRQVLNGKNAEALVRYRHYPEGDIARTKVQQEFILALLKQKFNISNLAKTSQLYNEISKNIVTNYPSAIFSENIKTYQDINFEDVKTFTLPGKVETRSGLFYYVVNISELEKLTEKYFIAK